MRITTSVASAAGNEVVDERSSARVAWGWTLAYGHHHYNRHAPLRWWPL